MEDNEPERWAQSKFTKERWGKLNNNPIESWNNWMCRLRQMSIPCLISGHLQKLGKKMDMRKAEVEQWRYTVGGRIEKMLRNTLQKISSVVHVNLYSRSLSEYSAWLTNNRCLVVKVKARICNCKG